MIWSKEKQIARNNEIKAEMEAKNREFRERYDAYDARIAHEDSVDESIRGHEAYEAFNTITSTTIEAIMDCYKEYCDTIRSFD